MATILSDQDLRIQEILDELGRRGIDPNLTPEQAQRLSSRGIEAPSLSAATHRPEPATGRGTEDADASQSPADVVKAPSPPPEPETTGRTEEPVRSQTPSSAPSKRSLKDEAAKRLNLEEPPPPIAEAPEVSDPLDTPQKRKRRHPGLPANSPLRDLDGFKPVTTQGDERIENIDLEEKTDVRQPEKSRSFEEIAIDVAEFLENPEPQLEHGDFLRRGLGAISKKGGELANEIDRDKSGDLPVTAKVIDSLRSLGRGLVSIPESMAGSLARIEKDVSDLITGTTGVPTPGLDLSAKVAEMTSEGLRHISEELFPENPELKESFVNQVSEGLGGAIGFGIGGGLIGKGVKSAGVGAEAAPRLIRSGMAGMGFLVGGEQQAREAEVFTDDPATIRKAYYLGGFAGTSEAIGVGSTITRVMGRGPKNAILGAVREAFIEAAEEAIQEGFQTLTGNQIAKKLYHRQRDLLDGFFASTAAGGTVGSVFSLMMSALGSPRLRNMKFARLQELQEAIEQDPTPISELKIPQVIAAEEGFVERPFEQLPDEALTEIKENTPELSPVAAEALEREIELRMSGTMPQFIDPDKLSALPAETQINEAGNIQAGETPPQAEIAPEATTEPATLGPSRPLVPVRTPEGGVTFVYGDERPSPVPSIEISEEGPEGQIDFLEFMEPLEGERRGDEQQRKRVRDMTPEEREVELLRDFLTGIGNRRALQEDFEDMRADFDRAVAAQPDLSTATEDQPTVAAFDLAGLKYLNDTYGDPTGDALLKAFAEVLDRTVGFKPVTQGRGAYRTGGDEFMALFQNRKDADQAVALARELFSFVEITAAGPDGKEYTFTGASFDAGFGTQPEEAGFNLKAIKNAAIEAGTRQERGERPDSLVEESASGEPDQVDQDSEIPEGEAEELTPINDDAPVEEETSADETTPEEEEEGPNEEDVEEAGDAAEGDESPLDETPSAAEPEDDETAKVRRFMDAIGNMIESGKPLNNKIVNETARDIFGRVLGKARIVQDAVEGAAFRFIEQVDILRDPKREVEQLLKLTERLNRQSVRDTQQVKFQQFSTPPAEAYAVIYASAINNWPIPGVDKLATFAGGLSEKEFRNASVHFNGRGEEIDTNRDFTGWLMPVASYDQAGMGSRYTGVGKQVIIVPKQFVRKSRTRPDVILPGFRPQPYQIRTLTQKFMREDGSPDLERLFRDPPPPLERVAKVLEPSAGTGSLAMMAKRFDADVTVNEIDERRRRILRILGFENVLSHDAEQIDNLLPADETFDVVVMNPPFSSSGDRGTKNTSDNGNRHIAQALRRLRPGGRLVAIHGRGAHHGAVTQKKFWREIFKKYHVRANLEIDGKAYGKFGTNFNNRIIVIDNTGPTPGAGFAEQANQVIQTAKDEALSPTEAVERLKPIAEEKVHERIQHQPAKGESEESPGDTVRGDGDEESGPGDGADLGGDSGRTGERDPGEATSGTEPAPGRPLGETEAESTEDAEQGGLSDPEERPADVQPEVESGRPVLGSVDRPGADGVDSGVTEAAEPVAAGAKTSAPAGEEIHTAKPTKREFGETEQTGVFAKYLVQKARIPGSKAHPANIVESATMASVDPPDVHYKPTLPKELIESGKLSDVQLESIVYAGQKFQQKLPTGETAGYWIGDGTGVGKGREIAGIMYDQLLKGHKKALWVSINHDLGTDAKRDAEGIGLPMEIIPQTKFKKDAEIPTGKDGIVFTAYSFLRQGWKDSSKPRLKQLQKWLGEDFDGVIAFDEAHLMKNAIGSGRSEQEASDSGSDQGAAGLALQAMFPKAKVIYVTATGATEARNMAFMARLGLWGPGLPFPDFRAFLAFMNNAGVGGMEMLARDLKGTGSFASRSISYEGVEYDTITTPIEGELVETYNNMAEFWAEMLKAWDEAGANAGQDKRASGSQMSQMYSTQQRFFLQMMTSFQVPALIKAVRQDIAEGRQSVINLLSTNEGSTRDAVSRALAEGVGLDEIDFSPRDMMVNLIEKYFPLQQFQTVRDPETGNTVKVPVLDSAGNPVINRENLEKQKELIDRLANLSIPENPLDLLVNEFGPNNVAEITGRKHRLEGKGKNRKLVRRKIKGVKTAELNNHETKLFQEGRKKVAIISAAGSTGISLHSDVNSASKDARRSFHALQLAWSADVQLQSFGRVHRSFQESAPIIRLHQTTLAGQKRLTNAVSKRLAGLGALTRGGRETLGGDLFRVEDLTDSFGRAALQRLYASMESNRIGDRLRLNLEEAELSTKEVLRRMGVLNAEQQVKSSLASNPDNFLNRIMILPVDVQNAVFEEFYEYYLLAVDVARETGTFDLGVQDVAGEDIEHESTDVLHTDPISGAETALVQISAEVEVPSRSFEDAQSQANLPNVVETLGFFKQATTDRPVFVVRRQKSANKGIGLFGYNTRRGSEEIPADSINQKWLPIKEPEAKALWAKHLAEQPKTKREKVNLLTGAVFPVIDRVLNRDDSGDQMRVKRATTTDGQRFVGLEIPSRLIEPLKQRFGIGTPLAQASPEKIVGFILDNDSVIELDNGWTLAARKVAGERRIELIVGNVSVGKRDEIVNLHKFDEEMIQFRRRFFIPADPRSEAIRRITPLLQRHKAIRDQAANLSTDDFTGGGDAKRPRPRNLKEEAKRRRSGKKGGASRGNTARSSSGLTYNDRPIELTRSRAIKPLEMPELVQLVKDLTGDVPHLKKLPRSLGYFKNGLVVLDFRLFKNVKEAAYTLAHEIGHLIDFLPDHTLKRGNLLGRLHSLRGFLKESFGEGSITNKEIRDELISLARYWSPFDPQTDPPNYVRYRQSARELYADAISVLLNSPGTVERIAPSFYDQFFMHLQAKQAVQDAYFNLQMLLGATAENVVKARRQRTQESFDVGEARRKELEEEALETPKTIRDRVHRTWQNTRVHFDDKNAVILEQLGKFVDEKSLPHDQNPRFLLEEMAMADSKNHEMLRRMNEEVIQPFLKFVPDSDRARNLFGEYLLNRRVRDGDREALANPQGITPNTATATLRQMKEELGDLAWSQLEQSIKKFHDIAFELSTEAMRVGVYSKDRYINTILPNRETYATFEVIDFMDRTIGAGLKNQRGTFRDITNPFASTMLKLSTLNRLIAYNRAKRSVVQMLKENRLGIAKSEEIKGKAGETLGFKPNKDKRLAGRIELLEDGKVVGHDVDPYIAQTFNREDPSLLVSVARVLHAMNHKVFHPLYITWNVGFHIRNLQRDLRRSWKAGGSLRDILVSYVKALPAAQRRASGVSDVDLSEMISAGALDVPFTDSSAGILEDDTYERLLRRLALGEDVDIRPNRKGVAKFVMAPLDFLQYVGDFIEAVPKIAGWNMRRRGAVRDIAASYVNQVRGFKRVQIAVALDLDRGPDGKFLWPEKKLAEFYAAADAWVREGKKTKGFSVALLNDWKSYYRRRMNVDAKKIAYEVRNFVGTPNFRKRGRSTYITSAIYLYQNVALQGLKADATIAMDPQTRGGYWFKTAMVDILPKMLMMAATAGLLGDELKEWFEKIGDYDLTHYTIIPLGWKGEGDEREAVYLRLPHDESGRLVAGLLWHTVQLKDRGAKGMATVFDFGADQFPGIAPPIEIASAWSVYLAGDNPRDSFLGREIISRTAHEAGGTAAAGEMLEWTVGQTGLMRVRTSQLEGKDGREWAYELGGQFVREKSGMNSLIRSTNFGAVEKEFEIQDAERRDAAQFRLSLPEEATILARERSRLQSRKERLSPSERRRLAELNQFNRQYLKLREKIKTLEGAEQTTRANAARRVLERTAARYQ